MDEDIIIGSLCFLFGMLNIMMTNYIFGGCCLGISALIFLKLDSEDKL